MKFLVLLFFAQLSCAQFSGNWTATGNMTAARDWHTATLLPNGLLLVAGGRYTHATALYECEVFDPSTGQWTVTSPMINARYLHTANLLHNGLVLVAGGETSVGYQAYTELFNYSTGLWTATGSMAIQRSGHTATLLNNGFVVVAGGSNDFGILFECELFNPSTGEWKATGMLIHERYYHTDVLLQNGLAFVIGGEGGGYYCETFDLSTGQWTATGLMSVPRYQHTTTLLQNGLVLAAGGRIQNRQRYYIDPYDGIAIAELFNASTRLWTITGSMTTKRYEQAAALLLNGFVLVGGGRQTSSEVYDPSTGNWTEVGLMMTERDYYPIILLQNGAALAVGGSPDDGETAQNTCELFAYEKSESSTAVSPTIIPSQTPQVFTGGCVIYNDFSISAVVSASSTKDCRLNLDGYLSTGFSVGMTLDPPTYFVQTCCTKLGILVPNYYHPFVCSLACSPAVSDYTVVDDLVCAPMGYCFELGEYDPVAEAVEIFTGSVLTGSFLDQFSEVSTNKNVYVLRSTNPNNYAVAYTVTSSSDSSEYACIFKGTVDADGCQVITQCNKPATTMEPAFVSTDINDDDCYATCYFRE